MPSCKRKLKALALVASLKHKPDISNTQELTELVAKHLKKYDIETEIVRLVDYNIPASLKYSEGKGDDWPKIAEKVKKADIILFGTPIWWGGHSSVKLLPVSALFAAWHLMGGDFAQAIDVSDLASGVGLFPHR